MTPLPELHVALDPPPGWVEVDREPDVGTVLLSVAPGEWPEEWGLRPTIVVAADVRISGSIRAAAATWSGTSSAHRFVAWDLWDPRDSGDDGGGRRVLRTHRVGTALVCTMTWLRLEGSHLVTVTATVDADRYVRVMPLMTRAVTTLRVVASKAHASADEPLESDEEPPLDAYWARHGEVVEDLGALELTRPWHIDGLALSLAAYRSFADARHRPFVGARVSDHIHVAELHRVGLVDERGRLTEDGAVIHADLRQADRRIRIDAMAGATLSVLEVARSGNAALVWSTASPSCWAGETPAESDVLATTGMLRRIPLQHVPDELAAWLLVEPAWPPATNPATIPAALIAARAEQPLTPPPMGADAHLRAVWAERWFTWDLRVDTGHEVAGVHAGKHGHFRRGEGDHVQAFPPDRLFEVLVGISLL